MPAHIISSEQQRDRMLHTPIPKLIVSLSIPTLASQLISVFYNTADTYFVSNLSTSASAAVGVVFSLMSIIQAFGFGIGMGCGSIVSRSLGNRDNERADRIASSAFFAAAPAVVRIVSAVGVAPLLGIAFEIFFLIHDGIAISGIVIVAGQPLIESGNFAFSLFHAHDALLSD